MDNQFLLIFDNILEFLNIISNYKVVHVFLDESVDNVMQKKLFDAINCRVQTIKTVISPCYATEQLANSLPYLKEDFVLAVGKLHLQSLVKYYCYANNLQYAIVPVKEIAEYSFSKYAFIKDVKFDFYICEKPNFAFINKEYFSNADIYKLIKIISYKNIVAYEKEFEKLILQQSSYNLTSVVKSVNLCDGTYKSVIKLYSAIALLLEKSKTSKFLGCEYTVLSLLNTNKKDITQNLISSTNLLSRFYECVNKFSLIKVTPNYNKHILLFKKQYGFNISQIQDNFLSAFTNEDLHKVEYTFRAYEPHLKTVFNSAKSHFMFSKISFNSKELELALALSSGLSGTKNILRLTRDLGYFENLLKI